MALQMLQRVLLTVTLWLLAAAASTAPQASPAGCPDTCGSLTNIPYPFGIKAGCSLNQDFLINCSQSSSGSSTPYLRGSKIQVTNISVEGGQVEILQFVARDCYDSGSRVAWSRPWLRLSSIFAISNTQNKFTAVGCDTNASITGNYGNETYTTGCMSYCDRTPPTDTLAINNWSCSGIGCCQVSIPSGLRNINVAVTSFNNHSHLHQSNPCSYAFVTDESKYDYSSFQSLDELKNIEYLPLVLDWTIGINETCETAEKKAGYACQQNSNCYNSTNGYGYGCKCKDGYHGNPYLSNGCQDDDECKDGLHDCIDEEHCINSVGGYNCFCPKGHHGDGRKNGTRCTKDRGKVIEISIAIGVSVLVLVVGGSWLLFIHNKRKLLKLERKFFEQNGGKMLQKELSERQVSNAIVYSAEQLKEATNNYDESSIIGKGGFGTVYKGILKSDGCREIAIKKPKTFDPSQAKTFIYEFIFLSQINHPNVVKLLGCCLEREVPLLVYEFVPNGTLYDHIHKKNNFAASTMSWQVRLRVATEIAEALSSLHSASPPIIHRDVKPQNILLDNNYKAKVSDFGASRLVPMDQTQLSTMVQGTFGYLDPEYFHTGQFTEKSDVYSFGVVLVELLTSKKAISMDKPEEERSLVHLFLSSIIEDDHRGVFRILDDQVSKEGAIEQIKEVAELAKRCLSVKGEERPRMEDVAMELKGLRVMGEHPWVGSQVNSEEIEHLLISKPSIVSSVNTGYHNSIHNQAGFEINYGR